LDTSGGTSGAVCETDARYFTPMPRKARKPEARPSGGQWFVYMVRCADGSLYTGIAKDVARRCQQHSAGTASRYTRSRLPVELVYREGHPTQSSALKREAAIKAMDRREKLAMAQQTKKPAKGVRQIARPEDIPSRPRRRRRPAAVGDRHAGRVARS
jgi:predicted GIY-YIG superfamily endonuclease